MSAKLGTLTLDLVAKTGRYTEPLKNAERATKRSVEGITNTISTLKGVWGVAGVALSAATGLMATKLVAVQREFDVLNAGLITATKSSKDAKIAFDALSQFAKETPYGLSQAVEAFNKLVNLGLTPSEQALMSYGNTASAMGKDLMQLIEAVADASTFEFERLKEFGIKSKQEGDKVKFTFQGVTTEVKKNASDIEQYLIKLGENQFAGAMSERMNTLDGDVAGLEDSWNSLWLSVSQSGVGDLIRVGIQEATTSIDDLTDVVKSGAIETALSGMGKAFNIFSNGAQDDINSIGVNFSELSKHLIQVWQSTVNELNAIGNALNIGKSWVQKATVGLAAGWDIITDPFNKASSNSSKQAAFESSMIAIDEELIAKKDAVSKAFKNAEKQLAAFNTKTKEGRDVLADYKIKTQDSAKETDNDTKKKKEAAKAQNELNRRLAEQARLQESIVLEFSTDLQRMQIEYTRTVKDINAAGFTSDLRNQYLAAAKARLDDEQLLFKMKQAYELSEFKLNEEAKAKATYLIDQQVIANRTDITTKEKEQYLASLKEKHTQELAWLELEKQQRLLDSRQFYLSEAEYMQERYQLERDEIAKNMQLTQQERDARIAMLHAEEEYEKRKNLKSASMAWGQSYADMTGTGAQFQIEQDRFNRYDDSQALFDSQMALAETAAEREAIWQAHNERMLAIDEDYQARSNQLSLSYGEQITGSFADIFKTIGGEQSGAYKAMFAVQKGFAIAQSIMAIQTGIANAMALPFPANLGAAATVAAETASIISNIQAVTLTGMAHDGIASVPEEGTWLLKKGERVLNDTDNKAFTEFFNSQSNGEPNITINNNTGANVSASRGVDGRVYVTIDEVENFVSQSLGMPNSRISKSLSQNTNAGRRR